MKKIIVKVQPFTMKQTAFVYEDGNKIDAAETNFDNFNDEVLALVEKHNITEVELVGAAMFSKWIGERLLKAELNKYNKNTLQVKYL